MSLHVIVGAGPVGSTTALELLARGHRVRLVSRSGSGPEAGGLERLRADAADVPALLSATEGAASLYNCANPRYDRWELDWPPIAAAMLAAAEHHRARLVTMSNLYGYGPTTGRLHPDLPLASQGRKGRVRARMWADAMAVHDEGRVAATEARASDFFGPGCTDQSHLGSRAIPNLLRGRTVRFLGDPEAPHSLTYVPDVALTLATLGTDDRAPGRAWHVPSHDTSYAAVARRATELAGAPPARISTLPPAMLRVVGLVNPVVRELGETRYQFDRPFLIDASDTTATFGIEPTPLDDALRATVADWLDTAQPVNATVAVTP